MIGKTISHYRILSRLGGGGMGVVYGAEDTRLERRVALKFLPPELTEDKDAKERFATEARAASALDHPNICTVYDIGEADDGRMFIALAYYDGETLKKRIEKGPLPVEQAVDITRQVAIGLSKSHERGVVHRDIKPANLMLTNDGVVKILDFGLAKLTGGADLTMVGASMGTPAYMSPEQAVGKEVDQRTDIWSLGVVLHEMLTGRKPFTGESAQSLIYAILNDDPPPIASLAPALPLMFGSLLARALAKEPSERYQTMAELLEDLSSASDSSMTITATAGTLQPRAMNASPSIAVLPFANMSSDPEQEYFCDGMAEEIINALTKLEDLDVVARTSAFQFKGQDLDVREIGRQLGVANVLEGSVRKAGNRLRVTAQLIKVADGYHLWSERYDRDLDDVFAIQDEISGNIVDVLKVKLAVGAPAAKPAKRTTNREAYDLYLRGIYYLGLITEPAYRKALECFEQAIVLDPDYAAAHAGVSGVYTQLSSTAS